MLHSSPNLLHNHLLDQEHLFVARGLAMDLPFLWFLALQIDQLRMRLSCLINHKNCLPSSIMSKSVIYFQNDFVKFS